MIPIVSEKALAVADLCRRQHVRRLDLFGSAATGRFNPATSDLDFLVEFEPLEPAAYADAYFGLLESLQALFNRSIDLVTAPSIKNPYFAATIASTKQNVYAA